MTLATVRLSSPSPLSPFHHRRQPPPPRPISPICAQRKQRETFFSPLAIPKFVASSPKSLAPNTLSHIFFLPISRGRSNHCLTGRFDTKAAAFSGRNQSELSHGDDFQDDPFWISWMKETIWALKSLSEFLIEQPGQLKYIEWPSFKSTLKTATLTLVLVALLIIALSSLDSALCYLLAFFLRRAP